MHQVHHTLKHDLTRTILLWSAGFFALLGIVFMLSFNTLEGYILELMADHRLSYQTQEFAKHMEQKDPASIKEESDALIQESVISAILMVDTSGQLIHVSLSNDQQPRLQVKEPVSINTLESLIESRGNLHLFTRQIPGHNATLALVLDDRPVEAAIFSTTAWTALLMLMLVLISIKALHFTLRRQLVVPVEKLKTAVENKSISDQTVHRLEEELPEEAAEILDVFDHLRHSTDDLKIHLIEMMEVLPACFWWSTDGKTYAGISGKSSFILKKAPDEIVSTPLWSWTGEKSNRSANMAQLEQAISKKDEKLDFAYQVQNGDQPRWFGESVTVSYDSNGNLDAVYGIINDISTRKNRQREQAEQQELIHRMDATATLVGGIAHEFNNALAGMNGNIFLIKQATTDPQTMQRIARLEELIERSATMIDSMLAFARKSRMNPDPIVMTDFLKNLQVTLLPSLPAHAQFNLEIADGLDAEGAEPPVIKADRKKMQEIMMQLIDNAAIAVEEVKIPRINICLGQKTADDDFLHKFPRLSSRHLIHIQVQDNGCGIASEAIDRIFEPFFTTREVGRGTGLGLSMVYGYINQIGGAVDVSSEAGKGTTFDIYLPRVTPPKQQAHQDTLLRGRGEKVLVVDDDQVFRESTCEVLKRMGYETLSAQNGTEGIRVFSENRDEIRMIFMDILMPGLTGIQTARRIRKISPDIPIIYLTAYDRTQPLEPEVYEENSELINKPFRISVLSQAIQKALRRNQHKTS